MATEKVKLEKTLLDKVRVLPGRDGIEGLKEIKNRNPDQIAVILTGQPPGPEAAGGRLNGLWVGLQDPR